MLLGSPWPSDKGDGAAEMRWMRLAYLSSSHTVPFAGALWPFIILEKTCLKGMFFSSIKCQASPTLVFPCTYPSVNTTHLSSSVNTTNRLLVFKKPSSINRSPSSSSINRSLAREKQKTFSVFSLFCFFVDTCFGHSELRVCFSFL